MSGNNGASSGGSPWIVYGATGYTGELVVREAVRRGHKPVVAGRDLEKVRALAHRESLPYAAFPSDEVGRIRTAIKGAPLVLHCAGPFVHTAQAMREACLAEGAHYLDITGELGVLEDTLALGARAAERGVCFMGGVGFDVVPTDCLAKYVANAIPDATSLEIAISGLGGGVSPGTTKSALEHLSSDEEESGAVRRGGKLVRVPALHTDRRIRFADGRERTVAAIPWGDLATAYASTRIGDIVTYAAMPARQLQVMRVGQRALARVARTKVGKGILLGLVDRWVVGPDEAARRLGRSFVWAKATGPSGAKEAWLEVAEGYTFTARSSVRVVERVLGERPSGALTPSLAFGADFVLEIEGSRRFDALP